MQEVGAPCRPVKIAGQRVRLFHPSGRRSLLLVTCVTQVVALQRQLSDANASSAEIGSSAAALMDLVGEGPALQAMLNCYSHKIRLDQSLLLKQHTAGADRPAFLPMCVCDLSGWMHYVCICLVLRGSLLTLVLGLRNSSQQAA